MGELKLIITKQYEEAFVSKKVTTHAATIAMNPEIFDMMIKGIYSDEVTAPARELICNARDSHVESGKTAAIKIHAPTPMEPWFSVQDFGLGMSEEMVTVTYMCLGTSTKRESNELIGAKGIGSKSPFALVDAFQVCSVHDGIQTSYSVFKDKGLPMVAPLHSKETAAGNGVEVKFAVEPDMISTFQKKLQQFLTYFNYPYDLNIEKPKPVSAAFTTQYEDFKVTITHYDNDRHNKVVMGGVPYNSRLLNNRSGDSVVVEIPIGACDVDPGREWTVETHAAKEFTDKLNAAVSFAHAEYQKKVKAEIEVYTKIIDCQDWYRNLSASAKAVANQIIYDKFGFGKSKMMRYYPTCSRGEMETPRINSLLSGETLFLVKDKANYPMQRAKKLMQDQGKSLCFVVSPQSDVVGHPMLEGFIFKASHIELPRDPKPKEKRERTVREKGHRVFVLNGSGTSEERLTKDEISSVQSWVIRSDAVVTHFGQFVSTHTSLLGTVGSNTKLSAMMEHCGVDKVYLLTERQSKWANSNNMLTIKVPAGVEKELMMEYIDLEDYNESVSSINAMRVLHGIPGRLKEMEAKTVPGWIPKNVINKLCNQKNIYDKAQKKMKALRSLKEQTEEIMMQNYPLLQSLNDIDYNSDEVIEYIKAIKLMKSKG